MACIGLTETLLLPLYLPARHGRFGTGKNRPPPAHGGLPISAAHGRSWHGDGASTCSAFSSICVLYLATALLALVCMKVCKHDALQPKHWKLPNRVQLKHSIGYATLSLTAAGPSELDKMLAVKLLPLGERPARAAASRVIGAATLPVTAPYLGAACLSSSW